MTIGGGCSGGACAGGGVPKKRQRVGGNSRGSSTVAVIIEPSHGEVSLPDGHHKPSSTRGSTSRSSSSSTAFSPFTFNDATTADVILRLFVECPFISDDAESTTDQSDVQIYLHSDMLRRSKYFAALLSDRWQRDSSDANDVSREPFRFNLGVSPTCDSINNHLTVLQLLYTCDFTGVINSASKALSLLPVALHLLFEDCVKACVKLLEAVPWTEEEERRVLAVVPLLGNEEAEELLARFSPSKHNTSEEMLYGLVFAAIHNYSNMAFAKAFVSKLLRDFSSKESAKRVLDRAFDSSLKAVKLSLEMYMSPDFRGDHNETEAIQRLHLHTALSNGKHLLWLIERMIELKVADKAAKDWSDLALLTANLQCVFRDDSWRNIVPGLPAVLMRCTSKLAEAVATGNILAPREVRVKLVEDWLPVLILCKEVTHMSSHKSLYSDLEKTFLTIISTLPLSDSQGLLQQCVSFSTRNVEDCDHLVSAFTTWFRRANSSLQFDNLFQ